jgi:hypothetical protein
MAGLSSFEPFCFRVCHIAARSATRLRAVTVIQAADIKLQ